MGCVSLHRGMCVSPSTFVYAGCSSSGLYTSVSCYRAVSQPALPVPRQAPTHAGAHPLCVTWTICVVCTSVISVYSGRLLV